MHSKTKVAIVLAAAGVLMTTALLAEVSEVKKTFQPLPPPPPVERLKEVTHAAPIIPTEEPATRVVSTPNAGFNTRSAFTAVTPSATTGTALTPPVTITYSGASDALTIIDSGTGRGITDSLSNTNNANSAFYGETYGSGAGLTGYNKGTKGPGGKFAVVNSASAQAGVFATTNGTGPAVLGTITTASNFPAVYGQSLGTNSSDLGTGVEGDGKNIGVHGDSQTGYGVFGSSNSGVALSGTSTSGPAGNLYSNSGEGLSSTSISNYAVYAETASGKAAVYATNGSNGYSAAAVYGTVSHGNALQGVATDVGGYGVYGSAAGTSGYGVTGTSVYSYGVYAFSSYGTALVANAGTAGATAGDFRGNVTVTGSVTAASFTPSSDRNLKTDVKPIDGKNILERVTRLPISSWDFKTNLAKRHVGPMAQDFHAAFGLNGKDDTHIDLTDTAGISLAAIQQLGKEMKVKDAEITELRAQLAAQSRTVLELKAMSESFALRMAALENQRDTVVIQNAALHTSAPAHLP